jgi:hypothetical protein
MAIKRVVPIPLEGGLDVLWGLRFEDLPWLGGTFIVDLGLWHVLHRPLYWRLGCCMLPAGIGAVLTWATWEEQSIRRWIWLWLVYQLRPKKYQRPQ